MPRRDPFPYGNPYGPIWIDPNYLRYPRWGWTTTTITTDNTSQPIALPAPTEADVRRIVREEIAELPIPFDVPDAPPEA